MWLSNYASQIRNLNSTTLIAIRRPQNCLAFELYASTCRVTMKPSTAASRYSSNVVYKSGVWRCICIESVWIKFLTILFLWFKSYLTGFSVRFQNDRYIYLFSICYKWLHVSEPVTLYIDNLAEEVKITECRNWSLIYHWFWFIFSGPYKSNSLGN